MLAAVRGLEALLGQGVPRMPPCFPAQVADEEDASPAIFLSNPRRLDLPVYCWSTGSFPRDLGTSVEGFSIYKVKAWERKNGEKWLFSVLCTSASIADGFCGHTSFLAPLK